MIRRGRTEGWLTLSPSALQPWSQFSGGELHGVKIDDIEGRGCGVVAEKQVPTDHEADAPLISVPRDLVLSLESVKKYAQLDKKLAEILRRLGDFGDTTRGAILTFLLCQATLSCPEATGGTFVRTPFAEYVKFLPLNTLPTSWTSIPDLQVCPLAISLLFFFRSQHGSSSLLLVLHHDFAIRAKHNFMQTLLSGTTLGPALAAKINSLQREYDLLKGASGSMPGWWETTSEVVTGEDEEAKMARLLETLGEERDSDEEAEPAVPVVCIPALTLSMISTLNLGFRHHVLRLCSDPSQGVDDGLITFDDWLQVDNFYRSRALEFPGIGDATVPIVDMANHASGDATAALYECDANGDAVLLLRDGKSLEPGDEITITYGDQKGACEMLFSYGFIEDSMEDARELFLDLEIPDDDPLAKAKQHISKSAPGFKIFRQADESIGWTGDFIWLIVVNEEDGLDFRVLQDHNGNKELKAFWKDEELSENEGELQRRLTRYVLLPADSVPRTTRNDHNLNHHPRTC